MLERGECGLADSLVGATPWPVDERAGYEQCETVFWVQSDLRSTKILWEVFCLLLLVIGSLLFSLGLVFSPSCATVVALQNAKCPKCPKCQNHSTRRSQYQSHLPPPKKKERESKSLYTVLRNRETKKAQFTSSRTEQKDFLHSPKMPPVYILAGQHNRKERD